MPVILNLFDAVPERLIHRSFAVTMKATGNIVDYKVLYDQLHIKYADMELRFAGLTQQLAQLQKWFLVAGTNALFLPMTISPALS